MEEKTYKIIRFYNPSLNKPNKVIDTGLTLEQAQAWCNDPSTHTKDYFDGYTEE